MKTNIIIYSLLLSFVMSSMLVGQADKANEVGAVIVINTEGKVSLLDGDDLAKANQPKVGDILPIGKFLATAEGAKATLLLSNGTLITVEEKTKMKVGQFEQVPFESGGRKVSDLEGEPSNSKVELDLDFGSMIVKTKKLNKGSTFEIKSKVGTAGVRGTEFQLSQSPGAGVQLDVTESTVAFTPPGGQPMPVSQGQGLDVSSTGQLAPRPVNPAVAQNISTTNQAATEVSAEISLDSVSDAMTESAEMSTDSDSSSESGEGEGDTGDGADESNNEEGDSGESQDADSGDQPSEGESTSGESTDDGSASTTTESSNESTSESNAEAPPVEETLQPVETETVSAETAEVSSPAMTESLSSTTQVEPKLKIEELIEQNPDAKQMQETGKKGASASKLAKFPFNEKLLSKYREFPEDVQNALLDLDFEVVARLLSAEGFGSEQARKFTGFSSAAQQLVLGLEDVALVTLLDQDIDETLILSAMSPERVELSSSSNLPPEDENNNMGEEILELGDALRESGNSEIYSEVLELAGGEWTDEWLRVAEVANILVSDVSISPDSIDEIDVISGAEALANPFYEEISSLYGIVENDTLASGDDTSVVGGNIISVESGLYDLTNLFGESQSLIIGASESFDVSGEVEFIAGERPEGRVIIMSGDDISPSAGISLTSELSDLVVTTRGDVLLNDSHFESAREIAVHSLRDVELNNVSLLSDSMVRVKAAQDLNVDGLELSQSLPSLIMEATTIRLSNVDFPSATQVRLNSLKGPIDGKYPNFGTSTPASEQLGRVNFMNNVRSGGNLLMDRTAFDQFGGNISIGKLP